MRGALSIWVGSGALYPLPSTSITIPAKGCSVLNWDAQQSSILAMEPGVDLLQEEGIERLRAKSLRQGAT
jgi:hypothetical protein